MRPQPHPGIRSFAILFQQGLALARRYAKMTLHRFTSTGSDKLLHLPSLEVKHFPFNVVLFRAVDTDQVGAGTSLPAADHREISGGPKRPQTVIYTAAVPVVIAVTVQLPE